jgi:SAM-dependent methyltransferase
MAMHRAAAAGFARSAEAYERGRPGYPGAAVDFLGRRLDLRPGRTVVDVAAGTGKLSRALAATGAEVVAVEPVEAMRALIGPAVRAVEGTAEALPLPGASVDAVTVAQAFHWFDGDAALAEFHRVLHPGGALALVWNRRRLEDSIHAALDAILAPHRRGVPSHRDRRWREPLARSRLFGPWEEVEFHHEQEADAELLAARVGSVSFVARLPARERERVVAQARALVAGGRATLRYATEIQVSDRRG